MVLALTLLGMDLVDNRTAYSPDPNSGRYKQLDYLAEMLFRTRQACGDQLREVSDFRLYRSIDFEDVHNASI